MEMSVNAEIEDLSNDIDELTAALNRARLVSSLRQLFEVVTLDEGEKEKELTARYQYTEDEIQVLPYKQQGPETLTLNENGEILLEIPIVQAENEKLKAEIEKTLDTVLDKVNQQDDSRQMNQLNSIFLEFKKKLNKFNSELPEDTTILESIE